MVNLVLTASLALFAPAFVVPVAGNPVSERAMVLDGYTLFNLSLSMFDPVISRSGTTNRPPPTPGSQYEGTPSLQFSQPPGGVSVLLFGTGVHWYGNASDGTQVEWGMSKSPVVYSHTGPPRDSDWGVSSSAIFANATLESTSAQTSRADFGFFHAEWRLHSNGTGDGEESAAVPGSAELTRVVVETGLETEADSFESTPSTTQAVVDASGEKNDFFRTIGDPKFLDTLGTSPSGGKQRSYPRLVLEGSHQMINFAVPAKTSFMVIKGAVSASGGAYGVEVSPNIQPKDWSPNSDTLPSTWSLNSSCPWEFEATMFYMPLDPDTIYSVSVKPDATTNGSVAIQGVTFYSSVLKDDTGAVVNGTTGTSGQTNHGGMTTTGGPAPHPSNMTAIHVGSALGGAGGLLLIGGVIWLIVRHRRKRAARKAEEAEEKDAHTAQFTTYPSSPGTSSQPSASTPIHAAFEKLSASRRHNDDRLSISPSPSPTPSPSISPSASPSPPPGILPPPTARSTPGRRRKNSAAHPPVSIRPFWDPRLRLDRTRSATSSITERHSIMSSAWGDDLEPGASQDAFCYDSAGSSVPFFENRMPGTAGTTDSAGSSEAFTDHRLTVASPVSSTTFDPRATIATSAYSASSSGPFFDRNTCTWYRDNNRDTVVTSTTTPATTTNSMLRPDTMFDDRLTDEPSDMDDAAETSSIVKSPVTSYYPHDSGTRHLTLPFVPPPPDSPPPNFAQERDAGLLVQVPPFELIPPSYDPAWAESRNSYPAATGEDDAGTSTEALGPRRGSESHAL